MPCLRGIIFVARSWNFGCSYESRNIRVSFSFNGVDKINEQKWKQQPKQNKAKNIRTTDAEASSKAHEKLFAVVRALHRTQTILNNLPAYSLGECTSKCAFCVYILLIKSADIPSMREPHDYATPKWQNIMRGNNKLTSALAKGC